MRTQDRILQAADELFGEQGFDATTTREIGERSGVNKALIHYHFKSKDDLLEAVLVRYYGRLGETLRSALEGEGEPRERMVRLVDAYMDILARNIRFCRIVQREASGGRHAELVRRHSVPLFQLGVGWVKQVFPAAEGDLDAAHVLVSFYGMLVTWFTYGEVLSDLLGDDPSSGELLAARKRHLHAMMDLVLGAVG